MPTTVDTTTKQGCSRQLSGKKFIFFDGTKRNPSSSSSSSSSTTSRFRLPRRATTALFPLRFLRQLGNKVVGALTLWRTKGTDQTVMKPKGAATTMAPIIDSHRAEAIKDCIQFINSSSLPRTDSASGKEEQPPPPPQSIQ